MLIIKKNYVEFEQLINGVWILRGNSKMLLPGFICRIYVPQIQKEILPLYGV